MSDSARHAAFQIAETTYGTTPANPAWKTIRHTGVTLGLTKSTVVTEELRPDRQITDSRHGNRQTGGDVQGEFSYGTYDDFLQAVTLGTWAAKAAPYTANTISAAAADNSINDSANGLPILTAGDHVTISGFTGAGTTANQKVIVVSSTAAKMVCVSQATPAVPFIDDAAAEAVTVTTRTMVLKAGIVRRSFSVLRNFSDLTGSALPFHLLTGQEVDKLAMTVGVNALIKMVFSFVGKDFPTPTQTAPAGSTFGVATTTAPIDTFSGIIYEGGTPIAVVTEVTLTLENGLAARFVVGSPTTIRPSIGRSNLTAQVTAYFEDSSLLEKFVNETESSLVFNTNDLGGNGYRFTLPRIKYNGGQPDTQGQGAITIALPIQALMDQVSGSNIILEANPA